MAFVIFRSKVESFAKWKSIYDSNKEFRRNAGLKSDRAFQSKDDPNELVILFEWDSLERAKQFANSPELRERMQQAGVIGKPEVLFLEEV